MGIYPDIYRIESIVVSQLGFIKASVSPATLQGHQNSALILPRTDEVSNHVRGQTMNLPTRGPGAGIVGVISKRATADSRRSRIIQLAQLPAMIALILCIVGGIDEADTSASSIASGKKLFKAGIIIFLIVYILLLILVVITMKDFRNAPHVERRIYFAVAAALPFLAVRLLWSLLSVFSNNKEFAMFGGKPAIQLCMAVLEEFVVVCIYTTVGLTIPSKNSSIV